MAGVVEVGVEATEYNVDKLFRRCGAQEVVDVFVEAFENSKLQQFLEHQHQQ